MQFVDSQHFKKFYGNDSALAKKMIASFLEHSPSDLSHVLRYRKQLDIAHFDFHLHKYRHQVALVGLKTLEGSLSEIIKLVKEDPVLNHQHIMRLLDTTEQIAEQAYLELKVHKDDLV